ncbi:MAG: secretin N-terminal domain-containing protein [bacterium]
MRRSHPVVRFLIAALVFGLWLVPAVDAQQTLPPPQPAGDTSGAAAPEANAPGVSEAPAPEAPTPQVPRPPRTSSPRPLGRPAQSPPGAPAGQAAQSAQPAGGGLDKRIDGPVIARNQDLSTLISLLQAESGLQFALDEGSNKKVTFNLQNPTVREVLETVLPANGLDYIVLDSGAIRIGSQQVIGGMKVEDVELITRTFTPVYLDVTQLQDTLEGMRSPNGQVIIDPDSQKIIVRDIPAAVEAMDQLIQQLDVQTETRVFNLRYANAQEVADQLAGVINTQEGELFVDARNNRLIITDTPERLDQAQAIIEALDVELKFEVIPLAFALPEDVMPLIEGLLTENGYVDFDPRTNRIFLQDIPSVVDQVLRLVRELDIPTQQIWIEADIVQINTNKSLTLGTSAAFGKDIGAGGNPNAPDQIGSATQGFFSFNPFLTTGSNGLTLMDVSQGNYRFQIDAMVEKRMAEVIASPRLLVQDGEVGSFNLGSEEPYAVRQQGYYGYSSGGGGDYFTQRSRQVGTLLDLEVYASEAGYVEMYISMEDTRARRVQLANLGDGLAVDGSFITTAVTVKSGRTVVLGGIINRSQSRSHSGVPFISSIPVLGNLFKKKTTSDDKQKLLVFITPRIVNIDDPFDFAQVDNTQRLRDLQNRGVTKFEETKINDKLLDWDNEKKYEEKAIDEALRDEGASSKTNSSNGASAKAVKPSSRNNKKPSQKQQMENGVIRYKSEDK